MMKALDPAEPLASRTDEELLSRYREHGNPDDFHALLGRYERELYRYLARYLGDATLAEDVFQNTFLQVHLKRGLYEDGRPVRPWLYSIATHQAVDALRRTGRHRTLSLDQRTDTGDSDPSAIVDLLESNVPGPLSVLHGQEREEWTRRAISRLPATLRQTLILAYYQDMKYREIAEALSIPVGTVKSRLHAALTRLQEMAASASLDGDGTVP